MNPLQSTTLNRRTLLAGTAAAACTLPFAWAQQSAGERWRLLVNEAVTADLSISMLAMRYRSWAEYLGGQVIRLQNREADLTRVDLSRAATIFNLAQGWSKHCAGWPRCHIRMRRYKP